jgi:hypothetical protein
MSYKTTLNNLITSRGGGSPSSTTNTTTKIYGRVIDVILDEDHPEYNNQGGGLSINGVFYKPLNKNFEEESPATLPFAYQGSSNIKVVPVVGEIVEVEAINTPSPLGNDNKNRKFYTKIVNVWNNPNSGLFLDVVNNLGLDISSGGSFTELAKVNPIKSGPGDVQFEGRQGQSIRFTGSKVKGVDYIDNSNIGKPIIIISNGQSETEQGFTTLSEDINEDSSSIYMVSDHQIPLKQANDKRSAWNEKPVQADQFKGNQVIINGGRLFFNAKEHDIQLSSIKSIGLNTGGTINIDSTDYMCLDGSQIYLGVKSRTAPDNLREPVVLGNQLEGFLESVLNILEGMANDMATAKTVGKKPIPKLNKRGLQAKPVIQALKRRINPSGPSTLKSKKVFTE